MEKRSSASNEAISPHDNEKENTIPSNGNMTTKLQNSSKRLGVNKLKLPAKTEETGDMGTGSILKDSGTQNCSDSNVLMVSPSTLKRAPAIDSIDGNLSISHYFPDLMAAKCVETEPNLGVASTSNFQNRIYDLVTPDICDGIQTSYEISKSKIIEQDKSVNTNTALKRTNPFTPKEESSSDSFTSIDYYDEITEQAGASMATSSLGTECDTPFIATMKTKYSTIMTTFPQKLKKMKRKETKNKRHKMTAEDKFDQFGKSLVRFDSSPDDQDTSDESDYEWLPLPNPIERTEKYSLYQPCPVQLDEPNGGLVGDAQNLLLDLWLDALIDDTDSNIGLLREAQNHIRDVATDPEDVLSNKQLNFDL